MTQTVSEIVVGANGSIRVAPLATVAPSDPVGPYAAAWKELGIASEAGAKLHDAKTMAEIKGWQSFYTLRRIVTAKDFNIAFGLRQWNKVTVPLAFGGGAVTTAIAGAVATVSNKAVATNVVTLTTSAAHGFLVGQTVVVTGMTDATLNGTFVITLVGSTTTFSYALTHADVASAAATGTATVGAAYRYAPPAPSVIDEREMGIDWQDGTKNYRLIIPKGMVTTAVDSELTRTKAADLPITFGVTANDTGDPWYFYTDDPAFA